MDTVGTMATIRAMGMADMDMGIVVTATRPTTAMAAIRKLRVIDTAPNIRRDPMDTLRIHAAIARIITTGKVAGCTWTLVASTLDWVTTTDSPLADINNRFQPRVSPEADCIKRVSEKGSDPLEASRFC